MSNPYIYHIMGIFVLGDLHGAAKALDQCLDRSGFDRNNDVLIQLGDVVDGYDEVFECVETLLGVKNLIAIKGNHDDWFHEFLTTDFHPRFWTYGGLGTIRSYLKHTGKPGMFRATSAGYKTALVSSDIPASHRDFFSRQRLYYVESDNRCYVHGGFKPGVPFNKQRPEDFYWDRTLWEHAYQQKLLAGGEGAQDVFGVVPDFSEVYLGHTPTINWDTDQPLNAFNVWNLDTGAGHSGRLTIMDVETKEYWQSDPLPTLYSTNSR